MAKKGFLLRTVEVRVRVRGQRNSIDHLISNVWLCVEYEFFFIFVFFERILHPPDHRSQPVEKHNKPKKNVANQELEAFATFKSLDASFPARSAAMCVAHPSACSLFHQWLRETRMIDVVASLTLCVAFCIVYIRTIKHTKRRLFLLAGYRHR